MCICFQEYRNCLKHCLITFVRFFLNPPQSFTQNLFTLMWRNIKQLKLWMLQSKNILKFVLDHILLSLMGKFCISSCLVFTLCMSHGFVRISKVQLYHMAKSKLTCITSGGKTLYHKTTLLLSLFIFQQTNSEDKY